MAPTKNATLTWNFIWSNGSKWVLYIPNFKSLGQVIYTRAPQQCRSLYDSVTYRGVLGPAKMSEKLSCLGRPPPPARLVRCVSSDWVSFRMRFLKNASWNGDSRLVYSAVTLGSSKVMSSLISSQKNLVNLVMSTKAASAICVNALLYVRVGRSNSFAFFRL